MSFGKINQIFSISFMNDILDLEDKEISTNYRKWAFRCFLYLSILILFTFHIFPKHIPSSYELEELIKRIKIILIFGGVISLISFYFIFKMIKNKELKNYQYWFSIIGIPSCIILFTCLINY